MFPDASQLRALQNQLSGDLFAFAPELLLCVTIVLALVARLFKSLDNMHRVPLASAAVTAALGLVISQWLTTDGFGKVFTGLMVMDMWAIWFRAFILAATLVTLLIASATGLPDKDDSGDFVVLLLGAALGLMMMASANHLLMVFLAMEMASLPSYALAGFLKGKLTGSEAALKYVVFGAASSGVMLYGISLICAKVGTGYLPAVTKAIAAGLMPMDLSLATGLLLIGVGLGYKFSVVPFHVWLPDAFEGAAAEVGAFLSVASKAAAVGLTGRIAMEIQLHATDHAFITNNVGLMLAIIGAVTATFGNLAAYAQTNLKRLLGYSTIAHAGFLLAGLASINGRGYSATLVYLIAYLFANLGAFAVVAALRSMTGREEVASLGGLMKRSPALGVGFVLCVLSLLGLPPLAGFAGKFLVFENIYATANGSTAWLVVFGVLLFNTAIGAGYYLKLLRIAVLDEAEMDSPRAAPAGLTAIVIVMVIGTIVFGVFWTPALDSAAATFSSWR